MTPSETTPREASTMPPEGSVTRWIDLLRAGDSAAAQHLWERYFRQLVARARAALGSAPRRVADEEDVALSAFHSFCQAAEEGRFPRLDDRDDLWRLLVVLTGRKAAHQVRDEMRAKRGGGQILGEADLGDEAVLGAVVGSEPTPEFAAEVAEQCRRLLDRLGSDELRSIAVWQMEGYTVEEIATRLAVSARSVARKLNVIRDRWSEEAPS
jgi:DNA-directed RNA polymerase specialized sigma24 family protein